MYTTPLIKTRSGRYGNNHWIVYSTKIEREVNELYRQRLWRQYFQLTP